MNTALIAGLMTVATGFAPANLDHNTVLTVDPTSPVPAGTVETLTAGVTFNDAPVDHADGTVTFTDGTAALGTVAMPQAADHASLTVTLPPGTHHLTAQFTITRPALSGPHTNPALWVYSPKAAVDYVVNPPSVSGRAWAGLAWLRNLFR